MAKRPGDITPSGTPETGLTSGNTDIEKFTDSTVSTDADEDRDLEMATEDDASEETEQIRAQIEETRAGLGETIDAIQERLSFSNISEQVSEQVSSAIESAKDSVYEATIGKVAHFMKNTGKEISHSSLVSTAKENPLPFILIGVGAGLLAYQGFGRGNTSRRNVRYGATPRLIGRQERRDDSPATMARAQSGIGSVTDTVSSTVSGNPFSVPTRRVSDSLNSSSPRIAASVMAATWAPAPASWASSSITSCWMSVESMSNATRRRVRRNASSRCHDTSIGCC